MELLADRGFGDQKLYELLMLYGWDFHIRFRGNIRVESADGEARTANEWVPPTGRARMLRNPKVTDDRAEVPAVVVVHAKGMKEPWCLVTSRKDFTASQVVKRYGRRFTIEETFRDTKDLHFGLGLKATHIRKPDRRDRMLLLGIPSATGVLTRFRGGAARCCDRCSTSCTSCLSHTGKARFVRPVRQKRGSGSAPSAARPGAAFGTTRACCGRWRRTILPGKELRVRHRFELGEHGRRNEIEPSSEIGEGCGEGPAIVVSDPRGVSRGSRRVASGECLAGVDVILLGKDRMAIVEGIKDLVVEAQQEADEHLRVLAWAVGKDLGEPCGGGHEARREGDGVEHSEHALGVEGGALVEHIPEGIEVVVGQRFDEGGREVGHVDTVAAPATATQERRSTGSQAAACCADCTAT